jgi:protein-disulfide isomerase
MTMTKLLASGILALTLALGLGGAATAQETAPETPVEIKDFTLGSPDAPVKITEYASFTCSHCAAFHATTFKPLKAEYIDTGKVEFTLREVYFDRYGLWAAMMARCGGDMRYFGITDILFETQQEWAGSEDPNVVVENIKKIGRTAGMDDATLDACMKDGAMAEAMVARFEENMKADGVEGTPTLFINGTKHANMDYAALKSLIEAELAK